MMTLTVYLVISLPPLMIGDLLGHLVVLRNPVLVVYEKRHAKLDSGWLRTLVLILMSLIVMLLLLLLEMVYVMALLVPLMPLMVVKVLLTVLLIDAMYVSFFPMR